MKKWLICIMIYILVIIWSTFYCQPSYSDIFKMILSSIDFTLFSYLIVLCIKILEWTGVLELLMKIFFGKFYYIAFMNAMVFIMSSFINILLVINTKEYYYISLFVTVFTSVHAALICKKICERNYGKKDNFKRIQWSKIWKKFKIKEWQICIIIYVVGMLSFTFYCQPSDSELFKMFFLSFKLALLPYFVLLLMRALEYVGILRTLMKKTYGIFAYISFLNEMVFVLFGFMTTVIGISLKEYYYISTFITIFSSMHSTSLCKKICERNHEENTY